MMNLSVSTPFSIVVSSSPDRIHVPSTRGDWCLLPRHADCVLTLKPGIMTYTSEGKTLAAALNGGLCIKAGSDVMIATNRAVASPKLEDLSYAVEEEFRAEETEERRAQTAMTKVEIGLIRRLLELEQAHD